ncbi:MAG: hypothetical protein AAF984_00970 [Verrucomicrobiota bacterium]
MKWSILKKTLIFGLSIYLSVSTVWSQDNLTAAVEMEAVNRMERMLLLQQTVDEGQKLLAAGDVSGAERRFDSALENSMPTGPTAEIHAQAKKLKGQVLASEAKEAQVNENIDQAIQKWEEALKLDPNNAEYVVELKKVRQSSSYLEKRYPGNKAVSQDLVDRINGIRQLLYEGDRFVETGQYDRARGRYNSVLDIDPYNRAALKKMGRLEDIISESARKRFEARRAKALQEVTAGWSDKVKPSSEQQGEVNVISFEPVIGFDIMEKLESIRIPELNFTDVDVADAINFLIDQSRQLDPDGEGVNIVLLAQDVVSSLSPDAETAVNQNPLETVTLSLRDVPLIQVIEYVTSLTNLQFKIEDYAVFILPTTMSSEVMQVRSFAVPPTFFPSGLQTNSDTSSAVLTRTVSVASIDVKKQLEDRGIKFDGDATASYLPKSAKLVVRNTLEQLNLVDQLISREIEIPTQIDIGAKFIEFDEDKLKDFSFTYQLAGDTNLPDPATLFFSDTTTNDPLSYIPTSTGTAPNLTINKPADANFYVGTGGSRGVQGLEDGNDLEALLGKTIATRSTNRISFDAVVDGTGVRALISAIESKLGGDVMAAPRLTLISGQNSKIRISRELIYPEEYEAPQPVEDGGGNIGGIRSQPRIPEPGGPLSFTMRDVGVILDVKATATPDRRIDLELKPEIVDFQGFINYGQDSSSANFTAADGVFPDEDDVNPNNPDILLEGVALQPVFSRRSIDTKVQVVDGQTVVMGGLISDKTEEIEDRVPFLGDLPFVGRLFRSEVKRSVKTNLIIMVTARLVKPDGTPEYLTEAEKNYYDIR